MVFAIVGSMTRKQKRPTDELRRRDVSLGPLPQYVGYQVRQAQTAIFRDLQTSFEKLKTTPGEFSLLSLIEANPGITQVDLAALYRLDKSTLSLVVTRVVKRGLVERRRTSEDGRCLTLWLRRPGQTLLNRMRVYVDAQEQLIDKVLERGDRRRLIGMLDRISWAFVNRSASSQAK
ncbi:MAG: MarR family winged helix-turn-helix transcriptional regulator [Alphaproteobacteria bacterium]|nr:MarR family winged helix-turn-helix transcriptional regulator [Alphaproteobacteria bacterium]